MISRSRMTATRLKVGNNNSNRRALALRNGRVAKLVGCTDSGENSGVLVSGEGSVMSVNACGMTKQGVSRNGGPICCGSGLD